jgi:ATP-dependent DNA helicase PIF1
MALFLSNSLGGHRKIFPLKCIVHALTNGIGPNRRHKVLLLAPTGIAAMNISDATIHSALQITSTTRVTGASTTHFNTLLWRDDARKEILHIDTVIIDEISMVYSELLSYLPDLFACLRNVHRPFGKVNVILVGDLFQLPPVAGSFIFSSPVWSLFFPMLLSTSHRQDDDAAFLNMLEELRIGTPSVETIQQLSNKRSEYLAEDNTMTTTHIVGFRRHTGRLNNIITSSFALM